MTGGRDAATFTFMNRAAIWTAGDAAICACSAGLVITMYWRSQCWARYGMLLGASSDGSVKSRSALTYQSPQTTVAMRIFGRAAIVSDPPRGDRSLFLQSDVVRTSAR